MLENEEKRSVESYDLQLMRYNRCMLREELDDITTDACIGLESLLAGGTHTEITNAIASRMPFVISKVENK